MNTSAGYELSVVAVALACGVIVGFLYDLFRVKRRFIRTSVIFIHVEDILFWVLAAIIVFLASYIISNGEARFYFFLGVFLGSLLYFVLLSKIVILTLAELIKTFLWPFREALRYLSPIARRFLMDLKNLCGRTRNRVAIKAYHIGVDMRRIRNIMTKK